LDLSARELQNGSIVYKPNAEEISVELNITSRNGATASQSIRIVGATVQPRSPTPQAVAHENPITRPPRAFQPPPDARQTETRAITTPDIPLTNAAPNPLASTLPSLSPSLPEFAQSRREFHPAEPVHSPQPLLPADVRLPDYAYDRPLQIQVEVTVGLDGRVTAARLTGESGAWAGLLGPTALNAARMWRFRPAMLGGEPIRSTMVLTFRYARPR
jgi:outer membrane biosynthesis protein TonB